MPKSDYEIIDTWYAMGMAATGSKDVAVNELFVPERRALALQRCRGGSSIRALRSIAGPLFRIPIVAASSHPLAPAAIGAAEGAYELFLAAMASAPAPIPAPRSPISRPCRSRSRARAA